MLKRDSSRNKMLALIKILTTMKGGESLQQRYNCNRIKMLKPGRLLLTKIFQKQLTFRKCLRLQDSLPGRTYKEVNHV